ncbi:MAG: beta-galactosidase [Clostridia bacterium]|nr:beta-galactosidase [Clostridia bacterium]
MPRTDYPRPQWMRENWLCLNGEWNFAFDFGVSGEARGMVTGEEYPLTITVPFCPESKLSGIGHIDFIPAVWYKKTVNLEEIPEGHAILHFGAVDYETKVWVNGIFCGSHRGGYTSFALDVTRALRVGDNTIVVFARDDQRSGKQATGKQSAEYKSYACSYTRTTGIWQTVWMEFVGEGYMASAKMEPHAADGVLDAIINLVGAKNGDKVRLTAQYDGRPVGSAEAMVVGDKATARLEVEEIHLWNPGAPELYDLTLELVRDGGVIDQVESYFGLRDVTLSNRALLVNGKPVFMRMILDQGFNPDGIYTAPEDAFLKRDIELSMDLGFNGARLHQRIFEERTLYWADKLGYLLWSEWIGGVDCSDMQALPHNLPEWMENVNRDYNHPSVIGWCVFNETYHAMRLDENVTRTMYHVTKAMDPYRPVIDASGGVHYDTDMFDVHDYEQDPEKLAEYLAPMLTDEKYFHSPIGRYRGNAPVRPEEYKGQPYWVSECGGTFRNPALANGEDGWGYGDGPKTEEEFASRYEGLMEVLLSHPRVCGFCYTQLTDIEQEQNGLYFYDRSRKLPDWVYDRIREANRKVAKIEE